MALIELKHMLDGLSKVLKGMAHELEWGVFKRAIYSMITFRALDLEFSQTLM